MCEKKHEEKTSRKELPTFEIVSKSREVFSSKNFFLNQTLCNDLYARRRNKVRRKKKATLLLSVGSRG